MIETSTTRILYLRLAINNLSTHRSISCPPQQVQLRTFQINRRRMHLFQLILPTRQTWAIQSSVMPKISFSKLQSLTMAVSTKSLPSLKRHRNTSYTIKRNALHEVPRSRTFTKYIQIHHLALRSILSTQRKGHH
jgi:hypothetical protein